MYAGHKSKLIFVTVLTVLSVVAAGMLTAAYGDDFDERIKKIERSIEQKKKELEKTEQQLENLKSQEKKTVVELNKTQNTINAIHQNLLAIRKDEQVLSKDISSSQRKYDEARKKLDTISEQYSVQLRNMYKRQNLSPLGTLFSSGSVSAVMRGVYMLSKIAAADLEVISAFRQETKTISESMVRLEKALNAKSSLAKVKEREKMTLANTRDKKRKILESIKQDEKKTEELMEKYQRDLEQAQANRTRFIREREKKNLPVHEALKNFDFAKHKGKLPWPVSGKVVRRFGTFVDPQTKTKTSNRGVEIETKQGEPVAAVIDGEVVMTQFFRGYGNFVMVFHPPDYYTIYGHLSDILVNRGDIVLGGTVVGLAGSTGRLDDSTSCLLLEILKGEAPQNPLSWLRSDHRRAGL